MAASALSRSTGNRNFRLGFTACAALLLVIPLIAMRFSAEVNWGAGDFLVAGALLALLGLAIDLALRIPAARRARGGAITLAVAVFLLVWAELAVGVFD